MHAYIRTVHTVASVLSYASYLKNTDTEYTVGRQLVPFKGQGFTAGVTV